ncbi:MAG: benzoyl-CoA reductase, bzd-type, subunit O, partial [Thermoplasmata archaeon]|nr:benzoyl-CoA reductase, bzd-type, subunit O [Thermoplasmata archaeon]
MADTTGHLYPTEKLKCWNEAKEIREDYYIKFRDAHEMGGIRWAGGAWSFDAVPYGLGDDVFPLTGEPYGASIAFKKDFSLRCQEAAEKAGYARDLCSYMRNYWGSIILDEYAFGGPFPKPDFMWQDHICCSHAKWYQVAQELEGGDVPTFFVDVSVGPMTQVTDHKVRYVVNQLKDGIDWLQRTTGRDYDDQQLIDAVYNECRSTSTWAAVCNLNKAIPAPLDEKSMYSLYVLGTLMKSNPKVADFYEKLLVEVQDRVDRGIAAVP